MGGPEGEGEKETPADSVLIVKPSKGLDSRIPGS